MAEKISVQIALEGGKEVARQLEGIGEAGQKAFADIAKSAEQVGGFKNIQPEQVTEKLKELGITGSDTFAQIQQAVQKAARLETIVQGVQSVETALVTLGRAAGPVGLAIAAGFTAAAKATIAFAHSVTEANAQAMTLGLTIKEFEQLRGGLEKAGISAKAISSGFERLASATEGARIEEVTRAFEILQQRVAAGFSVHGARAQLDTLIQAAQESGRVAALARQSLDKLGLALPPGAVQSLQDLIIQTGSAKAGLQAFIAQLQQMPDGAQRTALAIGQLGSKLGTELIMALQTGSVAVNQFSQNVAGAITPEAAAKAAALEQALNRLEAAWNRFGSVSLAPTLTAGIDAATAALVALNAELEKDPWSAWGAAAQVALNPVAFGISKLLDLVITLGKELAGGVGGGSATAAQGKASGGLIGGRGTGTSDSNLAWVSRGEHIMPARAVRQPGMLAFLEALRRSGGNLSRVLDGMGRFALGGLVPRAIPAFAAGGPVGGMSNVTIQFPGLPPVGGLRASSEVVDQLRRSAALAQVRSGGRKPSRYS